jgi:hypothetical protein
MEIAVKGGEKKERFPLRLACNTKAMVAGKYRENP